MDPFIGTVILFAGNFAPRGWAFCDGQLLDIAHNAALFSILGTTYGGDGRTTFALPDLRGRVPLHAGTGAGPGLTPRPLGSGSGTETVMLTGDQMPEHTHGVQCSTARGDATDPEGRFPSDSRSATGDLYAGTADALMNRGMIQPSGSGAAHDNMPPFRALNYIIALVGIFPSRN